MLDGRIRAIIEPTLDRTGAVLAARGLTADIVTVVAFLVGAGAATAIAFGATVIGLVLILLSRLLDGLDGAIARSTRTTDRGGLLDIVLDFAFYGLIPLAFVIADTERNALAGTVLIFSFYVNGASFLAYAIMAEKRDMKTDARGTKSLYFTTGLAEATETIFVFVLFCLFPAAFAMIAYIFAAICLLTTGARLVLAWRTLR